MNNLNEFYALNLNEKASKLCVQNALDKIDEISERQKLLLPSYLEKKEFYESVRKEFMELQDQWNEMVESIKEQSSIVNAFSVYNSNTSPNKRMQRVAIKTTRPEEEKDMNVSWITESIAVFTKENRFMSSDELWSFFSSNERIVASCNKNKTKFHSMKGIALDGLIRHALRASTRKNGTQSLVIYNEKIGLADWVGADGIPTDPKHMIEFMSGKPETDERILKNIKYQAA